MQTQWEFIATSRLFSEFTRCSRETRGRDAGLEREQPSLQERHGALPRPYFLRVKSPREKGSTLAGNMQRPQKTTVIEIKVKNKQTKLLLLGEGQDTLPCKEPAKDVGNLDTLRITKKTQLPQDLGHWARLGVGLDLHSRKPSSTSTSILHPPGNPKNQGIASFAW